jgi:outer membrane protein assembly factor BamB
MRWKATLVAAIAASLVLPSGAASASSATALPTYHVVTEYDVGLSLIGNVDVEGTSLYATSTRRDTEGGRLARFDLATGDRLWRNKLLCAGWGPYAYRKIVLIQDDECSGSSPGTIDGVRASDGQQTYDTDGTSGLAVGRMAFLTDNDELDHDTISVWGYSIPRGHIRWEYGPFPRDRRFDVIAAGPDTVDVLNFRSETVTALDAKDGRELWSVQFGGAVSLVSARSGGLVLVSVCVCGAAGGTRSVAALDEMTGQFVWGAGGELGTVSDGVAYVNDGGALTARRVSDGALLWSTPDAISGSSDPQVGGGIVWIHVFDPLGQRYVNAYDAATGAFIGSEPWSRVLGFVGDTVLVSLDDGRVLAYAPA